MGLFSPSPLQRGSRSRESAAFSIFKSSLTTSKHKMSKKLGFVENFALSGAAAVISKTAAAPIERIKLLVQNQDEMIKAGRLSEPYKGVIDCTVKTFRSEGLLPFWRGNLANCLRYFPTQALTLPSRTQSRLCSRLIQKNPMPQSSPRTSSLVVLLVPCLFALYSPSTTPVPVWPTTPRAKVAVSVNSTA